MLHSSDTVNNPAWRQGTLHHILPLACLLVLSHTARAADPIQFGDRAKAHFLTVGQAKKVLATRDNFVSEMSGFDRQIRLRAAGAVDEASYLQFASEQALDWSPDDQAVIRSSLERVAKQLNRFAAWLPNRIGLIKTTGREEADAPHCRGNAIVLPASALSAAAGSLDSLLIHELFHILSRQPEAPRGALYAIVGFEQCAPIDLPPALSTRKITNPDAPSVNCVMTVQQGGRELSVAPILLSRQARYDSLENRTLFGELLFALLEVEKRDQQWCVKKSESPKLWQPSDVREFGQKIGRNTSYVIHPEEILADNFVLLVRNQSNIRDPWVVEKLNAVLMANQSTSTP